MLCSQSVLRSAVVPSVLLKSVAQGPPNTHSSAEMILPWAGGWTRWPLEVPSTLPMLPRQTMGISHEAFNCQVVLDIINYYYCCLDLRHKIWSWILLCTLSKARGPRELHSSSSISGRTLLSLKGFLSHTWIVGVFNAYSSASPFPALYLKPQPINLCRHTAQTAK